MRPAMRTCTRQASSPSRQPRGFICSARSWISTELGRAALRARAQRRLDLSEPREARVDEVEVVRVELDEVAARPLRIRARELDRDDLVARPVEEDVARVERRLNSREGVRIAAAEEVDDGAVPEPPTCGQLDVADAGERHRGDVG